MTAENIGCYRTRTDWNGWAKKFETLCSNLDLRKSNTDSWRTSVLYKDLTVSDREEIGGKTPRLSTRSSLSHSPQPTAVSPASADVQVLSSVGCPLSRDLFTVPWVLRVCGGLKSLLLFPLPHTWSNTLDSSPDVQCKSFSASRGWKKNHKAKLLSNHRTVLFKTLLNCPANLSHHQKSGSSYHTPFLCATRWDHSMTNLT